MTNVAAEPVPSDKPPVDMYGNEFRPGDIVLKAVSHSSTVWMQERIVERVKYGKVYLASDRLVALKYPDRVLNLSALGRD